MQYRRLGKTGLMVSQIGLGAEWLERHNYEECKAVIDRAAEAGINILCGSDVFDDIHRGRIESGRDVLGNILHRSGGYIGGFGRNKYGFCCT